jgi:hypothetical protein
MRKSSSRHSSPFQAEWTAAIACFVLAALTGTVFRFTAAGFAPLSGLDLSFVRNAHSHLMLFSWATPPLMALIAQSLARGVARGSARDRLIRKFRWVIRAALVLGLLSFVPFLVAGYGPMHFGPVKLPLSIIFSTVSMLVWYAFAVVYARARRQVDAGPSERLWDLAVIFLVVGSAGAWARGAFMGMGVEDPLLTQGSIQFFLVTFSFGWLLLGMLGEFHRRHQTEQSRALDWAYWLLALGVPAVFTTAIPTAVPLWLEIAGYLGSLSVAIGLGVHVWSLWDSNRRIKPAPSLIAFTFVAAGMLAASAPPVLEWADQMGLRIVFVHVILLGVVSLGLIESFVPKLAWSGRNPMPLAVVVLLVTMLPATGLAAGVFGPLVGLYVVAFGSLAPALAALWAVGRD